MEEEDTTTGRQKFDVLQTPCIGRVVSYSTTLGLQHVSNKRSSGFINVEFVCYKFGVMTDVDEDEMEERPLCRVHKVHHSNQKHAKISILTNEGKNPNSKLEQNGPGGSGNEAPGELGSVVTDQDPECTLQESLNLVSKLNVNAIKKSDRQRLTFSDKD